MKITSGCIVAKAQDMITHGFSGVITDGRFERTSALLLLKEGA